MNKKTAAKIAKIVAVSVVAATAVVEIIDTVQNPTPYSEGRARVNGFISRVANATDKQRETEEMRKEFDNIVDQF
jgi:hypothetical protein